MSISTAPDRAGGQLAPGPVGDDDPHLASLISVSMETFRRDYWGKTPLLSRAAELAGTAAQVLTLDDIDSLLSERGLRTPFVRVTREGSIQSSNRFTSGGGAGASITDQVNDTLLTDLLLDGSTVVLQALQRTWRPITDLVSGLSAELAVPVQANAYLTPPDSRGFDSHYDVHDVFVIQLAGRKHWQVHEPVHLHPLSDQPWTDHRATVAARSAETPLMDVVLEPGDVLYLPRGTVHGAVTRDTTSAHLTLGVHPVTAHAAALAAVSLLKESIELRASLPAGAPLDGPEGTAAVEDALVLLRKTLESLSPDDVATALARTVLPQTRPVPIAPLAQAAAVLGLDADTRLRLRAGLQTHLCVRRDGSATLITPHCSQEVPTTEVAAVRALRSGAPLAAGRLPGLALDTSLVLAGRLLRLGIAVLA